jgi:hypothetical protein
MDKHTVALFFAINSTVAKFMPVDQAHVFMTDMQANIEKLAAGETLSDPTHNPVSIVDTDSQLYRSAEAVLTKVWERGLAAGQQRVNAGKGYDE